MKKQTDRYRRKRFAAGICAAVILIGGSAGIYAFSAGAYGKNDKTDSSSEDKREVSKSSDDGIISGGGTITSSQLSDELGLKNTSARLVIEKVLAETGSSVTSGTKLYQITSDSLAKAKKTLDTELSTANNALIKQKTKYQSDKLDAYSLYQSQLLTGKNAQQEYNNTLSSLESDLSSAYDSYKQALDTVNSTPSQITKKKTELSQKQTSVKSLEEKNTAAQKELEAAEKTYTSAGESYNSIVSQYNSAASVVRYLGSALGKDVSGIELAQTVSVSSSKNTQSGSGKTPSGSTKNIKSSDMPQIQASDNAAQPNGTSAKVLPSQPSTVIKTTDAAALYENAYKEYTAQKEKLTQADSAFKAAEKQYKSLSESLSKTSEELKQAQSSVTELEKDISSLESSLSKAKSSLTKLQSQYESLKASYETDKLEAKNKLDTDTAASENAEYNYKITLNTLDSELEQKQSAYDIAAENVSVFEKTLAQGYICANQDGIISTLNYKEGRNADLNTPFVYYVDTADFSTTVELDQYDVTQINIGDQVIIYSSESGVVNGKITGITAGESTSLANVKFNVTVSADKGSDLYSGQSVNVYFNYTGGSGFSDYSGEKKSQSDNSGSTRQGSDFSGQMPAGFDPNNMPDFNRGKDD